MVATLFTGGFRVSEVVKSDHGGLKKENLTYVPASNVLRFTNVPVMKKYDKIAGTGVICHDMGSHKGHAVWDADHRHYEATRKTEPKDILRNCFAPWFEPFPPMIWEYAKRFNQGQYLFPFDRHRAYRIVRKISPDIWPHWFRSQRARQLGEEYENGGYKWNKEVMSKWFNWISEEMARVYAHDDYIDKLAAQLPGQLIR